MGRIRRGRQYASVLRPELLNRWHEGYFVIRDAETSETVVETQCVWQFHALPDGLAALRFGRNINVEVPGKSAYAWYVVDIVVTDGNHDPVMLIEPKVRLNQGSVLNFIVDASGESQ
jgi:hypothetical protein